MKYPMMFIGLVLGLLVLWGCSTSSSDISEVNEVEEAEQTDNLNQADEVNEAANDTTSTEEVTEVEQVEQVEETAQADDTEQADESEVVEEVSQMEEPVEADEANQSIEVEKASEVDQAEETTGVEVSNQVEEVSENVAIDMGLANVISVEARGDPGSYTFVVGISSPDEGCQQYADWWEVLNKDGELIYRRVLLHSHVNEQPFVRSGGPVEITADQTVWVRAHMNTSGYGVVAFTGSVESGFQEAELSPEFAIEAANLGPLPNGCDF